MSVSIFGAIINGYVEEMIEMIDYGSTTRNHEIPTATHYYYEVFTFL